jgi:branched-chain amino acid transport system permease protein
MAVETQAIAQPSALGERAAGMPRHHKIIFAVLFVLLLAAPFVLYPIFVMKVLCFALFAAAFNLLLGYGGLLSFGHAAFFGMASYVSAHAAKVWGLTPSWRSSPAPSSPASSGLRSARSPSAARASISPW